MGPNFLHIAVFDGFIDSPSLGCFNQLLQTYPQFLWSYHAPAKMGLKTLEALVTPLDAAILLGSASYVTDKHAWQIELAAFVHQMLCQNRPVLGLCFGHQLMVQYYGGQVGYLHADKRKQEGHRCITLRQDCWSFARGTCFDLAVAHQQVVFEVPDSMEVLAFSDTYQYECVRHKTWPFFATQAHPEADILFCRQEAMITQQTEREAVIHSGNSFMNGFMQYLAKR